MQISSFVFSPADGLVCVFESSLYTYINNVDVFVFSQEDSAKGFKQWHPGLVMLFTIGDRTAEIQFDIRQDEKVPPADNVLHTMQMPFVIEGDSGILIETPFEESKILDIRSGNYLLTVHQAFTGKYPLGHSEDASEEDKKWWPDVPTWMRMWFNRVDSLDEQVTQSHWNRPK